MNARNCSGEISGCADAGTQKWLAESAGGVANLASSEAAESSDVRDESVDAFARAARLARYRSRWVEPKTGERAVSDFSSSEKSAGGSPPSSEGVSGARGVFGVFGSAGGM